MLIFVNHLNVKKWKLKKCWLQSLEYLTGEAPKYDDSINQISMDEVQEKMLEMLQGDYNYDKIIEVISNKVGDKVQDLQFIRALITAICEACISG